MQFGLLRRLRPVSEEWGIDRGRPIDRYYIERFLEENSGDIHGRVLEFLDPGYSRKFGGDRILSIDVLNVDSGGSDTTIIADLAKADNIPSNKFDCIICTQVLQYVYDLHAALYHLNRILKSGGVILASLPGISKTTKDWSDYWRFTSVSAGRLFHEYFPKENVTVQGHGNVLTSIAFLHGLASEELKKKDFEYKDPEYEMLITVKAVKPSKDE
jgi:SAM-dependent methyltransferase